MLLFLIMRRRSSVAGIHITSSGRLSQLRITCEEKCARCVNHEGCLMCSVDKCEIPLQLQSATTHLAISSLWIFKHARVCVCVCVCVCVQALWIHSTPHLRNRRKEVVLAQADMASGKADGSLLTIISSPIMLQEHSAWSTYYTLSPHGKE